SRRCTRLVPAVYGEEYQEVCRDGRLGLLEFWQRPQTAHRRKDDVLLLYLSPSCRGPRLRLHEIRALIAAGHARSSPPTSANEIAPEDQVTHCQRGQNHSATSPPAI